MDKNGSIGTRHGEMKDLVKNPFKTPFMRRNFDASGIKDSAAYAMHRAGREIRKASDR